MNMIQKIGFFAVAATGFITGCPSPILPNSPPLLGPSMPRRNLEVQYTRLRVSINVFQDRTTLMGGVTDLDTGPFFRTGGSILSPPTAAVVSTDEGSAARSGTPNVVSFPATGSALVQTLPDAIAGILGQSGRFEIMSGGECDVRLAGALTAVSAGTATLDMRLISCYTKSDMASVTVPIKFTAGAAEIQANRDDLKNAVTKLVGTIPDPKDIKKGQIISREGNYVTLNLGKEDKLIKGMRAFAVTYGDRVIDPKSGEMLGDETFTGDLYVFAVFNRTARAWIADERGTKTKVGDYVIFK